MVDAGAARNNENRGILPFGKEGASERMKMGWYRVHHNGTCTHWSAVAQDLLGFESREVVGQDIHTVFHEMQADKENCPACQLHSLFDIPEKTKLVRLRHRDGTIRFVEALAVPSQTGVNPQAVTVVFRAFEEATLRSYVELWRIYEVNNQVYQAILRLRDLNVLYSEICRIMVDVGPFRMVCMGVPSLTPTHPVDIVAHAGVTEDYLDQLRLTGDENLPEGRGPMMMALRTGKPQIIQDIASDPAMTPWRDEALKLGVHSLAGFPVLLHGKVVGVLNLYHPRPHFFEREELRLIGEVVDVLAFAVEVHAMDENRRQAETQIRLAAKAFESQEAMTITDADANIVLVNKAFTKITGYSREEVLGKNPRILQSGRHSAKFYRKLWHVLLTTGRWEGEIWNRRKKGEIYPEWLTISAVKDEEAKTTHYVAHFVDLSEWKFAESEIRRLAYRDSLTDLANRRQFFQTLDQAVAEAGHSVQSGFLLFIDFDRFKEINDSLGHRVGDLLLQEVARRLTEVSRSEDIVARLGGDEFVLLSRAPSTSKSAVSEAMWFAEYVRAKLIEPYELETYVVHVKPSIGVRVLEVGHAFAEELVQEADLAMYEAKTSGGNRVVCYEPKMKLKSRRIFQLEQDLRSAIEREEIELYYQGQFDSQGRLIGAEVLSRWRNRGEPIEPLEFIPIAERAGLIMNLGMLIFRGALQQLHTWNHPSSARLPRLSINISAGQFRDPSFVEQIRLAIEEAHVDPGWVVLEITESVLMENPKEVRQKIAALRGMGVEFSIDDFGTGYSSLAYLHTLPIQELKIDRDFTKAIITNISAHAIAKSILAIGQSLFLRVVAEGVETAEERENLFQLGCKTFQGYYFMKPLPAGEFEKKLVSAGSSHL